uniref:Predicted protein n=1 Tax=Hordeum vulgare subsp. vulgare TaxID=112509 RepID=F2DUU9_HORVV|nr:predicted protein [Hordeum vulgare subsp. vulgare]
MPVAAHSAPAAAPPRQHTRMHAPAASSTPRPCSLCRASIGFISPPCADTASVHLRRSGLLK